jgi:hypothetical protein
LFLNLIYCSWFSKNGSWILWKLVKILQKKIMFLKNWFMIFENVQDCLIFFMSFKIGSFYRFFPYFLFFHNFRNTVLDFYICSFFEVRFMFLKFVHVKAFVLILSMIKFRILKFYNSKNIWNILNFKIFKK